VDFRLPMRSGDDVLFLERVSKAYGKAGSTRTSTAPAAWASAGCVMGENGAGKSTLLKMVVGAVSPRPVA